MITAQRLGERNISLIKTSSFGHDQQDFFATTEIKDSAILEWKRSGRDGSKVHILSGGRASRLCTTASAEQSIHIC